MQAARGVGVALAPGSGHHSRHCHVRWFSCWLFLINRGKLLRDSGVHGRWAGTLQFLPWHLGPRVLALNRWARRASLGKVLILCIPPV